MIELEPAIAVEPAALRFARQRSVEDALNRLGTLTAKLIPDANQLRAEFHEDPDAPGLMWVSFRVEVAWQEPERVRQARNQWYAQTANEFPPATLANFGLEIDRRPE